MRTAKLQLRFRKIGFGLLQIGPPFFGVAAELGLLLLDLMAQVVESGLGVARVIELLDVIELGDGIPRLHFGPVRDQRGQREAPAPCPASCGTRTVTEFAAWTVPMARI